MSQRNGKKLDEREPEHEKDGMRGSGVSSGEESTSLGRGKETIDTLM